MSDPFAVRMNFKRSYLEKMTSSPASQMRAAAYAMKYKEQDEDLHSCILEQLEYVSFWAGMVCQIVLESHSNMEQSNINLRANIMYFIEHLCDLAHREGHHEYIANVEKDMARIIELVAPSNKAGATNIRVIRKVRLLFLPASAFKIADRNRL
jgi:CTD kinase subunit gamma